jgi:hypothetical protein
MAKDDFTVQIEDGRIMFMTSYIDEFGEERKVANIITKERLIEIHDNCNRALAELSNENSALSSKNKIKIDDPNASWNWKKDSSEL